MLLWVVDVVTTLHQNINKNYFVS